MVIKGYAINSIQTLLMAHKNGEPIEKDSVSYENTPVRAIRRARRPSLRTTHHALRI